MKNLYSILFVIFLFGSLNVNGQKNKKEKETTKTVVGKKNLTFTKPKNAWQVGIFGGASTLIGDVTPNLFYGNNPSFPGHNFGIFVSKSWSYLISTRLRYSTSVMFTTDAVASTLTSDQYAGINKVNDIGIESYNPGSLFFHNSRTQGHDINFDLVFTLGNINYHKESSAVVFRVFPTIGLYMYQTFHDHLDENNDPYNYNLDNLNELGKFDRVAIIEELNTMRDGRYETRAEEHSVFDENKLFGYNPRVTFGLGAGFAIRLTKFMSLDIESRQALTNDDLIDGMQWQEPGSKSATSKNRTINFDTYNQTTLGLTFSFVSKKVGEPLCMQNPLWGADAHNNEKEKEENLKKDIKNDSLNLATNKKVDKLEKEIDNLEILIKLLAQKNNKDTTNSDNDIAQNFNEEDEEKKKLTAEKERLKLEAEALKGGQNDVNNLEDNTFKLRNGDYIYTADLEGEFQAAYYLIIGSFRVKSNAKNDQKIWTEKGIKTYLLTDVSNAFYRVVVDYTNDHPKALDLLDDYQKKLKRTIWLIKDKSVK